MADLIEAQKKNPEGVPQNDGRLISENSGQFGVSDLRRAELSRLERDAGIEHEAADESVPDRPVRDPQRAASLPPQPDAARPGDRH